MKGYEVISVADDAKLGTVVREEGDYVVFEHGRLRKQLQAVPRTTLEVDEDANQVRTTLSKGLIEDSPRVDEDGLDRDALDRHYGAPDTTGDAIRDRLETRESDAGSDRPGGIPRESPAMLGERYSSADVPEER